MQPMTVLHIQQRLKELGYNPGPIDGAMGPTTRGAIRQFQTRNGLAVDGIVGPKTSLALSLMTAKGVTGQPVNVPAPSSGLVLPPWYLEAQRLLGTKEAQGPANNSLILLWAQRLGLWYPEDAIAWCGLFVAHCMSVAVPDEPQPSNQLGARNWVRFGVPSENVPGAVLVFSRPGSSWSGHVGFYAGEDRETYSVLGGNQSDSVSITRFAKGRLLGCRWPKSVAKFGSKQHASNGPVSTNEA